MRVPQILANEPQLLARLRAVETQAKELARTKPTDVQRAVNVPALDPEELRAGLLSLAARLGEARAPGAPADPQVDELLSLASEINRTFVPKMQEALGVQGKVRESVEALHEGVNGALDCGLSPESDYYRALGEEALVLRAAWELSLAGKAAQAIRGTPAEPLLDLTAIEAAERRVRPAAIEIEARVQRVLGDEQPVGEAFPSHEIFTKLPELKSLTLSELMKRSAALIRTGQGSALASAEVGARIADDLATGDCRAFARTWHRHSECPIGQLICGLQEA